MILQPDDVFAAVAVVTGVSSDELKGRRKTDFLSAIRQLAMVTMYSRCGTAMTWRKRSATPWWTT